MLKNFLLFFSLIFIQNILCYSQTDDIQILFKDVHNENISRIAVHPEGTYFFTADKSGKIIMWRTNDYSYVKTIYKGAGLPVRDMRMSNDGKILLVTEGMQGRGLTDKNTGRYGLSTFFNYGDSLAAYYPFSERAPVKKNISCDVLGHEFDGIILLAIYENNNGNLFGFDNDFSKNSYFAFQLEKPVQKAAINTKKQWLAYSSNDNINNTSELHIVAYNNDEILYTKVFDEEILEIVFDDTLPILHIISYKQEQQSVSLYSYDLEKKKLINTNNIITGLLLYPYVYTQKAAQLSIIIDTEYIEPLILRKQKDGLKKADFNFQSNYLNSTAAAFIPSSHHLILWSQIHEYYGHNPELHVYDYEAATDIERYHLKTRNNISAAFLPANNWYVEGYETNAAQQLLSAPQKKFIKYYKAGTFINRFGRLNFKDYIQDNYKLELMDDTRFIVDEKSGMVAFVAFKPMSTALNYYVYDLINNEIDSSFSAQVDYTLPLCFRNQSKHILAAGLVSFEGTRDFAVVAPHKTYVYKSHYTHAELSLDGKYIVLCDTSSTIRIFEAGKKKPLFEMKFDKMNNISLCAADESSFCLSYSYWDKDQKLYLYKSLLLEFKDGIYTEQVFPQTSIVDVASNNNTTAIIFDNITTRMLFINEHKKLIFSGSEVPVSVSLDEKAEKLMLVLKNGIIQIYDIETMTLNGSMLHPDSRTHVILKNNGFFSANTDVTTYLYAENDEQHIPFKSVENYYNKPEEVLTLFGQTDGYYSEMLEKTSYIRQKKYQEESISKLHKISRPEIKKITYDGAENISVSNKKEVSLSLEIVDSLKNTLRLQIKINNSDVISKDYAFTDKDSVCRFINCNIPLVKGENILNIKISNAHGVQSEETEHFILCNASEHTSNLYLLAIGVSDYSDNAFNLTFADKDAIDLALLYGDTSSVPEIGSFKDKFFGERFTVNVFNTGKRDEEIRFSTTNYGGTHYFNYLQQLDYEGYYWLEKTDSIYFLWDFKNERRKKISLPELYFNTYSLEPLFIPSYNNDGFYYKDEKGAWYKYLFMEDISVKTILPDNIKFFSLSDDIWVTDTIVYNNSTYQSVLSFYNTQGILMKQKTVEFETLLKPELLSVSSDGSYLLYALHDELWLVENSGEEVKKIMLEDIKHEQYRNSYHFDKSNTILSCLQILYEDEGASYNFYVYDIKKGKIKKDYIKFAFNTFNGINNTGGVLKWLNISPPVGKKKEFLLDDYISQYTALKPVSFENVFIEVLTNQKANKDNIVRALMNFYSSAGPNDQIILFLAGHGVLDTSLNYWFAPYDMDFKKPDAYGLGYDEIITYLNKIKTVRKLLIMDSCHSGDIFEKDGKQVAKNKTASNDKRGMTALIYDNAYEERVSDIMAQLFDNISSQQGITVLTASAGTDVAYESPVLSNGAFTTAYIESIENVFKGGWGQIDTEKLKAIKLSDDFIYELQKRVITSTQNKQIPHVREINKWAGVCLW